METIADRTCDWDGVCGCVNVAGARGKARKGEQLDWCLRPTRRTLHLRLRSVQLVHDEYLHQWPIDAGAVLALLPTEWSLSCPTLLAARGTIRG